MENGKPLRGNEEWCDSKLLGSLLESRDDVMRRIMLGDLAFQKFMKVWSQSQLPLQKKLLALILTCDALTQGLKPHIVRRHRLLGRARPCIVYRSSTNPKWATLILRAFKSYSCTVLFLL